MLSAVTFLFPQINFVLLDSDCLPITLFEIQDLWKEARLGLGRESHASSDEHTAKASRSDNPTRDPLQVDQGVLLVTEHNAEINAGFIVVFVSKHSSPVSRTLWKALWDAKIAQDPQSAQLTHAEGTKLANQYWGFVETLLATVVPPAEMSEEECGLWIQSGLALTPFATRQIGAQSLPRQLWLLICGETHKEVDISGAHYELTRALCKSQSLPPICALRERLRHLWASRLSSDTSGEVGRAIKLFPIRVINSGAAAALNHLHLLGLDTPPWASAFAFDLDAARKVTTEHLLQSLRLGLDVAFRNRRFFAVEAIESIVMQLFLLEVRKRCFAPSIIWLHDGVWIDKHVDNEVLSQQRNMLKHSCFQKPGPRQLPPSPLRSIH